jgi:nitrate/nitrite transporter NarK
LINSIGNLGGFVGPYAIGWIKDATGETTLGLVALAAGPFMAGVVMVLMGHDSKWRWRVPASWRSIPAPEQMTAFRLEGSDQKTGRSYIERLPMVRANE